MAADNLEGKHILRMNSSNDDSIRILGGSDIPVAQSSGLDCSKELHALPVDPNEV